MAGYYNGNMCGGQNSAMSKEEKILCSVDDKWERMDQFSNRELKKYTAAKRMRKPYHARCRKHTQAPLLELTCSHCEESKPYEDFSNAQRKEDDDSRRCRTCVNYTETYDVFQNLPGFGDDEALDNYKFENNCPDHEPEEGHDADPGVGGLATESGAWTAAHRNVDLTSGVLDRFDQANPRFPQGDNLKPSSVPTDTASISGGDTRRSGRQPQTYIAYGPDGERQQRAQSVVTASETASIATTAAGTAASATATKWRSWPKINGRKMAVQAPDFLTYGKADENFAPKRYDYSESDSEDEC